MEIDLTEESDNGEEEKETEVVQDV